MSRLLILLLLLLLTVNSVFAQETTIFGVVTDKGTGDTVPVVNVFLSGTATGTAADADGYYKFTTDLIGEFNLIVSSIGYKTAVRKVNLRPGLELNIDFQLEADVFQLGELSVSADKNTEWEQRVSDFKRFFIGDEEFLGEVVINNVEVLNFDWNERKNEYTVTISEPLKISNYALGYEVEVLFDNVVFDPYENTGFYRIFPRYTQMLSDNKRDKRKWNKNRKYSYQGSSRHFFLSLIKNKVKSNKFDIFPRRSALREVKDIEEIKKAYSRNWQTISRNYKIYKIENINLAIGHNLELTRDGRVIDNSELSSMRVTGYPGYILVDKIGNLYKPETVQFLGKWSNDRFSKSLPLDYRF